MIFVFFFSGWPESTWLIVLQSVFLRSLGIIILTKCIAHVSIEIWKIFLVEVSSRKQSPWWKMTKPGFTWIILKLLQLVFLGYQNKAKSTLPKKKWTNGRNSKIFSLSFVVYTHTVRLVVLVIGHISGIKVNYSVSIWVTFVKLEKQKVVTLHSRRILRTHMNRSH